MFRKVLLIGAIISVSMLSGCNLPKGKPVQDKMLVTIVGIDKKEDTYTMTLLTQLTHSGSTEKGQECPKTKIFSESGKTLFDINRNMRAFTDFSIFWGNLKFIIIGEELAQNGIDNSLDFFVRDHEHRLTANVVVSNESTAKEFIESTDMTSAELTDKLDSLFGSIDTLSESREVSVLDVTKIMDSDNTQILLPCVNKVDKSKKLEARNELGQYDAKLDGYAIFKRDKLAALAKDKVARGVNWILDEIKSGIILVEDPKQDLVSLEIIDSSLQIEPNFDDLSVTFKVKFSTNIGEVLGNYDFFNDKDIDTLIKKQEQAVEKEIIDAMELIKSYKTDVVGIGDAFYHKDPKKWNAIKHNWCNIFAEIPYNIEITSRINRSFIIVDPVEEKSEGYK